MMNRCWMYVGAVAVATIGYLLGRGHQETRSWAADTAPVKTPSAADEIKRLEGLLPDQAHAMSDVGYHFSNLWFAAEAENWPLAQFYANETKSHLHWAVRIKPIRKDAADRTIELEKILEALENTALKQLTAAIEVKDSTQFSAAYRFTLEGCYSCHKASDKPYLRLRIPERPDAHIIQFDPKADWPK